MVVLTFGPGFEPPWGHRAHVTALELPRLSREQEQAMLEQLTRMERGRLEIALEEVRNFQRFIGKHFRLDLLR